jgi:A/G-specific adenine glycosylase
MTGVATGDFAARVLAWYDQHGRHDLPWQTPRSPYRVLVSEIMLQQTQVTTVIPVFERFMQTFSDVEHLANASEDAVLAAWSGLGYYSRARNLQRAARLIVEGGGFPSTLEAWMALPGVGRSTAGAILSQAFGQPAPILDGNVRRFLARHAGQEGWPGETDVQRALWDLATSRLPGRRAADYTQAMMDLGARICRPKAPRCEACPVLVDCIAYFSGRTQTIPGPRPKRVRPTHRYWLLLLEDGEQRLWFERRPDSGVWACLWSFPQVPADASWKEWSADQGFAPEGDPLALTPVAHALTHRVLELQPLQVRVRCEGARPSTEGRWLTMEDAVTLALPAPVRRLINLLRQEAPHGEDGPVREARPRGRRARQAADAGGTRPAGL